MLSFDTDLSVCQMKYVHCLAEGDLFLQLTFLIDLKVSLNIKS